MAARMVESLAGQMAVARVGHWVAELAATKVVETADLKVAMKAAMMAERMGSAMVGL